MICQKCYALMIPHIEPTTIRWTCSNCNNETTERRYTDAEIERVQAAMADAGLAGEVATIEGKSRPASLRPPTWVVVMLLGLFLWASVMIAIALLGMPQ